MLFPLPGGEGQGEGERQNKSWISQLMSTLTLIFALPLVSAIALAFVPRNFAVIMRAVAVGVTFVTMLLSILMFCRFNGATPDANGYKFVSTIPWLGAESLGIA